MKYRTYPKTAITVSEVGFGLWTTSTGWWGEMSDADAVKMLQAAYDMGITLFDAADTYGNGRSEEQLAAAFAGKRDKVVYSTKFGYDFYNFTGERKGQSELPADFSEKHVRFALEQSLKRLRTDYIDIWQMHNAHLDQVRDDRLWDLLEELREEGKIRSYGVALGPAIGWLDEGLVALRERPIAAMQIIYNLLEQEPGRSFVPAAVKRNVGLLVRVPHSSGLLEGKFTLETSF
ncbi:MAG: aldo/keto reductase, partial [Vulcanimicrobiaceae bacterium]